MNPRLAAQSALVSLPCRPPTIPPTRKEALSKKLDLDMSFLRVETTVALPLVTLQSLKKVIHECASAGVSLLYWSPEPGVEADCESELVSQPWFTGYAVANAVLFRQDVVSSATGPLADVRDADATNQCDDVVSVPPSDKPDEALIDLGLVSREHSRFRRDPALTRAQFEAMYRAWVCNSISRKAADEVLVSGILFPKDTGEVAGMITLKLLSSDDGVGTDNDDGTGKNKNDKENVKDATNGALPSQPSAASTVVIIGLLAVVLAPRGRSHADESGVSVGDEAQCTPRRGQHARRERRRNALLRVAGVFSRCLERLTITSGSLLPWSGAACVKRGQTGPT
jgi:hypothetical protein